MEKFLMENFIFWKVFNKREVCSLQIRIRFQKKSRDYVDEIIDQLYLSNDTLNVSLNLCISPYLVRMREKTDQKYSK